MSGAASTILFKFRSGTTFEALPLPGTSARLFDVKRAIVVAKKLDSGGSGGMEFDLSVRDAATDQEYRDESMLLPRGTRVVVQRLPAPRGQGFLSRLARSQAGGGVMMAGGGGGFGGPPGSDAFYTIDGRTHDHDDDEFVSVAAANANAHSDEQELAALRAATDAASESAQSRVLGLGAAGGRGGGPSLGFGRGGGPAGAGGGGPGRGGGGASFAGGGAGPRTRPNADPELRDHEKHLIPKKRATGIPRTFLSLSTDDGAAAAAGGAGGGDENAAAPVPVLQPNAIGFEELLHRGGGQSEIAAGSKRDLEYALKVTATSVPEHLQCAICHKVVKDAMILPWDQEGRTTCETCIRDALTQGGFRCPLTGQEGVSPDDLIPNAGLRRAADQFVKGVFEKLQEIEQPVDDDDEEEFVETAVKGGTAPVLEGDAEKGVLMTRRSSLPDRKRPAEDDPFGGGGDEFGGDVFSVAVEPPPDTTKPEEAAVDTASVLASEPPPQDPAAVDGSGAESTPAKVEQGTRTPSSTPKQDVDASSKVTDTKEELDRSSSAAAVAQPSTTGRARSKSPSTVGRSPDLQSSGSRREAASKRRGPPVGYTMGPAHAPSGPGRGDRRDDRSAEGRGQGPPAGYSAGPSQPPHSVHTRDYGYDDRIADGRGHGPPIGYNMGPPHGRGGHHGYDDRGADLRRNGPPMGYNMGHPNAPPSIYGPGNGYDDRSAEGRGHGYNQGPGYAPHPAYGRGDGYYDRSAPPDGYSMGPPHATPHAPPVYGRDDGYYDRSADGRDRGRRASPPRGGGRSEYIDTPSASNGAAHNERPKRRRERRRGGRKRGGRSEGRTEGRDTVADEFGRTTKRQRSDSDSRHDDASVSSRDRYGRDEVSSRASGGGGAGGDDDDDGAPEKGDTDRGSSGGRGSGGGADGRDGDGGNGGGGGGGGRSRRRRHRGGRRRR